MEPNPYFLQYNATRGSVTYLDTALMQEFPKNIIGMASTRISSRHFFFYGGFQIENKSLRLTKWRLLDSGKSYYFKRRWLYY